MRMVFRVLAFVFAVVFAHTGLAGAKTVEEVLKEKGVITEAEYKEVTASRVSTYVPGKGFTFTSPDQNFQLSLGGTRIRRSTGKQRVCRPANSRAP
jgi:hypothetical protein